MAREVTLTEILDAREARSLRQSALLVRHAVPVVSFTLNIAGPVKDSPLLRRTFRVGIEALERGLAAWNLPVLDREERLQVTGCEALYAVSGSGEKIKRLCVSIEEGSPLGRLFDLDVLTPDGGRPDRVSAGGGERGCIVCGAPGRGCASRRVHSVPELQEAARRISVSHFAAADGERAASLATRALLDEVCVTPKPGLVDRANSGSHRDMDIFTFTASAAALAPYWARCAAIGRDTAGQPPRTAFLALRRAGQAAERTMLSATAGVNTHKGAIFTLGLLCGAVGRLWRPEAPCREPEALLAECAALASVSLEEDLAVLPAGEETATAGERLYRELGITGVRGEAARGLPGVRDAALPALRLALASGRNRNDAGAAALIHLLARVEDTNMIARGGSRAARAAQAACAALLENNPLPGPEDIAALDREFIRGNLSPGGCADLLAAAFFLLSWEEEAP